MAELKELLETFPGESDVILEMMTARRPPHAQARPVATASSGNMSLRAELEHILGPAALPARPRARARRGLNVRRTGRLFYGQIPDQLPIVSRNAPAATFPAARGSRRCPRARHRRGRPRRLHARRPRRSSSRARADEDNRLDVDARRAASSRSPRTTPAALSLGAGPRSARRAGPATRACPADRLTPRPRLRRPGRRPRSPRSGGVRRELHGEAGDDHLSGGAPATARGRRRPRLAVTARAATTASTPSDGVDDSVIECGRATTTSTGTPDEPSTRLRGHRAGDPGDQTISSSPVYALSGLWADGPLSTMHADVRWRWHRCTGAELHPRRARRSGHASYSPARRHRAHAAASRSSPPTAPARPRCAATRRRSSSPWSRLPPPDYYADPLAGLTTPAVDRRPSRGRCSRQLTTAGKALRGVNLRALGAPAPRPARPGARGEGHARPRGHRPGQDGAQVRHPRAGKPVTLAKGSARGAAGPRPPSNRAHQARPPRRGPREEPRARRSARRSRPTARTSGRSSRRSA